VEVAVVVVVAAPEVVLVAGAHLEAAALQMAVERARAVLEPAGHQGQM